LAAEDVLDGLDRLFRLLPATPAERLARLVLETATEALRADAAFFYPGVGDGEFERLGEPVLSAPWCEAFLYRLVDGSADTKGELTRNFLDPAGKPAVPWPCSAALICLGRPAVAWVAVLSFHPRRLFGPVDLRVLRLVGRLCLYHEEQLRAAARWQEAPRRR
jgi:hypothetical protein